jgi:hypothetical protein
MTKGKGVFKKVALSIATIIVGFIVTIVILARNEESQMSMDINVAEVDIKGEEFDRKQVKKEIEEDKEAEKYRDKRATRKKMVFDMDALQGGMAQKEEKDAVQEKESEGEDKALLAGTFSEKGEKEKNPRPVRQVAAREKVEPVATHVGNPVKKKPENVPVKEEVKVDENAFGTSFGSVEGQEAGIADINDMGRQGSIYESGNSGDGISKSYVKVSVYGDYKIRTGDQVELVLNENVRLSGTEVRRNTFFTATVRSIGQRVVFQVSRIGDHIGNFPIYGTDMREGLYNSQYQNDQTKAGSDVAGQALDDISSELPVGGGIVNTIVRSTKGLARNDIEKVVLLSGTAMYLEY